MRFRFSLGGLGVRSSGGMEWLGLLAFRQHHQMAGNGEPWLGDDDVEIPQPITDTTFEAGKIRGSVGDKAFRSVFLVE